MNDVMIKGDERPIILGSSSPDVLENSIEERKVAVLGTTPSRGEAPIADPTWEIWTIGPGGKDLHRWNRLYESHTTWPEEFAEYLNSLSTVKPPQQVRTVAPMKRCIDHWGRKLKKDKAWIASKITGDWAANTVIDVDDLYEKYRSVWFSTSIAYAVADVIEDHISRRIANGASKTNLGLYGIDLESDEEYISQFMGTAHLLDVAHLAGIDITMPQGCGLERDIRPYPNRYETHFALTLEKKEKMLKMMGGQAEQERDGARMQVHRIEGALIKIRELIAAGHLVWKDQKMGEGAMTEGEQQLQVAMQNYQSIHNRREQLNGELAATQFYQRMYTWTGMNPGRLLETLTTEVGGT